MFENLKFGKTGFKTCVLEKHFISYSCILFLIFNALRSFFKNQVIFFKNSVFSKFWLIQSVFRLIEITFKILCELLSVSINRNWFSINRISWISFLKIRSWLIQLTFFKSFQTFLSLSLSLSLSPTRQGSTANFFVVFLQISCKVSLSLSRYVYITLPFALIFTFSCIISWFFSNFQKMHNLGFLINQALFYKFDQWVLLLQCCIHDLYWLIWSIWGFAKN